ncbi:MAG TPA: hypothetical protein VI998_04515 [Patescibacteria group bacterium]|nr:hypothetical protein [Patescibacteria group bacterium]
MKHNSDFLARQINIAFYPLKIRPIRSMSGVVNISVLTKEYP